MKILFLDQYSELGGAQRCLLDLLPAVSQRGWMAHVAAPGNGPLLAEARRLGARASEIQSGPYESGSKSLRDLGRFAAELPRLTAEIGELIRNRDTGLVYVNGPRVLPAAALASRGRVPLLFHCHSFLRRRYARWLTGRSLRYARATTVASCEFVLQPLRRRLLRGSFHVVYNGVPPCGPSHRAADGPARRIGVIGRIAPEKGQNEFMAAARVLVRDGCNYRFVICGAPLFARQEYLDELYRLSEGVPVEFLGWRDDIFAVLSGLDLLVVPSAPEEATTRVILEAYVAGVPVLARRSGGIPEIVKHGDTGFLVDSGEPEILARAMVEAISAPNLGDVVENARTVWRGKYTLERYQEQVAEIIAQTCRAETGKPARQSAPGRPRP